MKALHKWIGIGLTAAAIAGYIAWTHNQPQALGEDFAKGNGRIEATEVDISCKNPGRIAEILVDEGDLVSAGQTVARMDTAPLQAQLAQAQALVRQAQNAKATAEAAVAERASQQQAASAVVAQRQAEYQLAKKRAERSQTLLAKRLVSAQTAEDDEAAMLSARAALAAANAQVTAAEAGVTATRSQVTEAQSAIAAAQANVDRLLVELDDSELKAPRDARVQYRIAQPGEVVGAGGKVLSTVDLCSVYMNFFLPERQAGRVAIGTQARIILDAAPDYVIPAAITYVADVAQFTPRSVETEEERQKLMFRVKARIDEQLLRDYQGYVKTGVPGVVYVRLGTAPWPDWLAVKLPEKPPAPASAYEQPAARSAP